MDKIEQELIELMADFLDSETVKFNEAVEGVKHKEPREKSVLHIRMAKSAYFWYKQSIKNG